MYSYRMSDYFRFQFSKRVIRNNKLHSDTNITYDTLTTDNKSVQNCSVVLTQAESTVSPVDTKYSKMPIKRLVPLTGNSETDKYNFNSIQEQDWKEFLECNEGALESYSKIQLLNNNVPEYREKIEQKNNVVDTFIDKKPVVTCIDNTERAVRTVCKSVKTNSQCVNGVKCQYAHTKDELNPPTCKFNSRCRNMAKCAFMHNETIDQYCHRLNIFS